MLLTVGDLLEEILVQLQEEPRRGRSTYVRSARVRGGSAANVAALTGERGGSSRFVGGVGADAIGRTLATDLVDRGVDVRVEAAGGTGVVVTLIVGGVRTRLLDRGASTRLQSVDLDVLDGVTQLYLPGSSFLVDPIAGVVDTLVAEAGSKRIPIVLGAMSPADIELYGVDSYLALVDVLHPDAVLSNRIEHAALGLAPDESISGALVTVITDGERPTHVINDRGLARIVSVHPVDPIRDRTGVGDGFSAGYLEARRAGADPIAAVDAGHRLAASVLRSLGPTTRRR